MNKKHCCHTHNVFFTKKYPIAKNFNKKRALPFAAAKPAVCHQGAGGDSMSTVTAVIRGVPQAHFAPKISRY